MLLPCPGGLPRVVLICPLGPTIRLAGVHESNVPATIFELEATAHRAFANQKIVTSPEARISSKPIREA